MDKEPISQTLAREAEGAEEVADRLELASQTTYWLKVGEGRYQYTAEVSMETYMAMERVCGLREDVPPDRINLPVTEHFMNPSSEHHLKVEGRSRTTLKVSQ